MPALPAPSSPPPARTGRPPARRHRACLYGLLGLLAFSLPGPAALRAQEPPPASAGTATSPPVAAPVLNDEAQRIYRKYGDALYQIQVIDLVTEKKTAIGSGFQFSADGMVATNYHVVADAIQRPEANRLEYVHDRYGTGRLKILTADIRYDLAILQLETPHPAYVALGSSSLPKGARLFSLGNPHDIGFTIVEGTYNGVSRESFIDKIHFSGAVNPGMSGGPVLGHDGRVAGINVMTAGNQIGFLVPVEPLKRLVAHYHAQAEGYDFSASVTAQIETQLLAAQDDALGRIRDGDWDAVPFGRVMLPGRLDPAFKCWASPRHNEKTPYTHHRTTCATEDDIFLDEGFSTGAYSYSYDLLRARKGFGSLRFYNAYEQVYAGALDSFFYMNAREKNVTNFACNNRFIEIGGQRWKASFCARRYKQYPALHDMQLYMALLGHRREGLIVTFAAQGVPRDDGLALIRRFIGSIAPRTAAAEEAAAQPAGAEDTP